MMTIRAPWVTAFPDERQRRLYRLQVEGRGSARDQHHVGELGGSKGGLVSVGRGVADEKVSPVGTRGYSRNGRSAGSGEGVEGHCGRDAHKISHQGVSDVLKAQRRV